jgi:hypothetical protein
MLASYLGDWALIALVIASNFLIIFCSFLLEARGTNNSGLLSFQSHLRLARELLPIMVVSCEFPFEQLAKRGVDWL